MAFDDLGRATRAYVSGYSRDRVHLASLRARERRALIANFRGAVEPERVLGKAVWTVYTNYSLALGDARIEGKEAGIAITAAIPGETMIRCEGTFDDGSVVSQVFRVNVLGDFVWPGDQDQPTGGATSVTTVIPSEFTLVGDLPDAFLLNAYSAQLTISGTAYPPMSWSISAGALPPGLTLDPSTGVVSGVPSTPGVANVTITATDTFGNSESSPQSITVSFSSALFAYRAGLIEHRSGADDTYPVIQSLPGSSPPLRWASTADGSLIMEVHTNSPYYLLWKKQINGNYSALAGAITPAPVSGNVCALSPDGTYMMTADSAGWRILKRAPGLDQWNNQLAGASFTGFACAKFSPDGNYIVMGFSSGISVWRRAGDVWTEIFNSPTFSNTCTGIAWTKDSSMFAACDMNNQLRMFSVIDNSVAQLGTSIVAIPGLCQVVLSNDGIFAYVRGNIAPFLRCYQWTGTAFALIANPATLPTFSDYQIDISADGNSVFIADDGAGFLIYTPTVGTGVLVLENTVAGAFSSGHFTNSGDYPE